MLYITQKNELLKKNDNNLYLRWAYRNRTGTRKSIDYKVSYIAISGGRNELY